MSYFSEERIDFCKSFLPKLVISHCTTTSLKHQMMGTGLTRKVTLKTTFVNNVFSLWGNHWFPPASCTCWPWPSLNRKDTGMALWQCAQAGTTETRLCMSLHMFPGTCEYPDKYSHFLRIIFVPLIKHF